MPLVKKPRGRNSKGTSCRRKIEGKKKEQNLKEILLTKEEEKRGKKKKRTKIFKTFVEP